jgi:hypothetical protein
MGQVCKGEEVKELEHIEEVKRRSKSGQLQKKPTERKEYRLCKTSLERARAANAK